jgi:hypothetical protein
MSEQPVTQRRVPAMWCYARNIHYPNPYQDAAGAWRCRDCGGKLTRYHDDFGAVRLRHRAARR